MSPLSRVVPLPNGLNGLQMGAASHLLSRMILEAGDGIHHISPCAKRKIITLMSFGQQIASTVKSIFGELDETKHRKSCAPMRRIKAAIQPGRQVNASLMMGQDMMEQLAMMDFKHPTQVFPYLRCAIWARMLVTQSRMDMTWRSLKANKMRQAARPPSWVAKHHQPQIPRRACQDPDQARPGQAEGTTPIIAPAQTSDGVKVPFMVRFTRLTSGWWR